MVTEICIYIYIYDRTTHTHNGFKNRDINNKEKHVYK